MWIEGIDHHGAFPLYHRQLIKLATGAKVIKAEILGPLGVGRNTQIGPDVEVGRFCSFNCDTVFQRGQMGQFCAVGARVAINPFNHPTRWLSTNEFQFRDDTFDWSEEYRSVRRLSRTRDMFSYISIGNDVWIGHNAVLVGNLSVGDGAVIAASAVVTRDVPPYAIVGGVPAKVIKFRFDDQIIARLLATKWWDKPMEELSGLPFDNVELCLDVLELRESMRVTANRVVNDSNS